MIAAIDDVAPADGDPGIEPGRAYGNDGTVALVGHSAGCAIAWAAADARPERVAHIVMVGGFPTADGDAIADSFTPVDGEVPLPPWDDFDAADLADMDDTLRARFADTAIPSPAGVTTDPQRLVDDRRLAIPVTVICTEFTGQQVTSWIDEGLAPVREFAHIEHLDMVDLPTGHWPQFTRPDDLADTIIGVLRGIGPPALGVGPTGCPEPPIAGDEVATVLGSLERQRATLAWKTSGLDPAGLQATVGASSMTLGGLLKHLAFVEDLYFTVRLAGNDLPDAWAEFDERDWDWRSAADDSPSHLHDLWGAAVARSRQAVADALATGGLDQRVRTSDWDQVPSMRRVLADVVEEYARHVGHADLLREAVDGVTGEDPPAEFFGRA